jgi:hypothetical protein
MNAPARKAYSLPTPRPMHVVTAAKRAGSRSRRRRTVIRRRPPVAKLAAEVARLARGAGELLDPALSVSLRAGAEQRLLAAWQALQPSTWTPVTAGRAVLQALATPTAFLKSRKWSEAQALDEAVERLKGVMCDAWMPSEYRGPDVRSEGVRELVRACLRAGPRGRPHLGEPGLRQAQHDLLAKLGLSRARNASALQKSDARKRKSTAR